MQAVLEPEPHHHMVQRKLKDSFTPTYLTALSVIQAVVLADLASVVLAGYRQFSIVHWLLVVYNFVLLIVTWNRFTVQSTIWDWIPDLRDAAIPFVLGALELLLNHTIPLSLSAWLVAAALLASWGAFSIWHVRWRAGQETENTRLLSLLGKGMQVIEFYSVGVSIFLLLLAVVSRVGSLEATDALQTARGVFALCIAILAGASLSGFGFLSMRTWSKTLAYARTGHMPGAEQTSS